MSRLPSLQEVLEKRGWQIESIEPESNDWWSFKLWKLTSTWSPVGYQKFLSFEIDPQMDELTERNVWSIEIGPQPPKSRSDPAFVSFNVRPWDDCVTAILDYLDEERRNPRYNV